MYLFKQILFHYQSDILTITVYTVNIAYQMTGLAWLDSLVHTHPTGLSILRLAGSPWITTLVQTVELLNLMAGGFLKTGQPSDPGGLHLSLDHAEYTLIDSIIGFVQFWSQLDIGKFGANAITYMLLSCQLKSNITSSTGTTTIIPLVIPPCRLTQRFRLQEIVGIIPAVH